MHYKVALGGSWLNTLAAKCVKASPERNASFFFFFFCTFQKKKKKKEKKPHKIPPYSAVAVCNVSTELGSGNDYVSK